MLAVSYVLQLEELAREFDAHNLAARLAAAMGGESPVLDWETVRDEFDRILTGTPRASEPAERSTRDIKLRALGIA